jgi:hypothetical protein
MSYAVTYDPESERARRQLSSSRRLDLDNGIRRIANPYGTGSSPTHGKDRREATCEGVFVVHHISATRLPITVVQVIRRTAQGSPNPSKTERSGLPRFIRTQLCTEIRTPTARWTPLHRTAYTPIKKGDFEDYPSVHFRRAAPLSPLLGD